MNKANGSFDGFLMGLLNNNLNLSLDNKKIPFDGTAKEAAIFTLGIASAMSWHEQLQEKTIEDLITFFGNKINISGFADKVLHAINIDWSRYENDEFTRLPLSIHYALTDGRCGDDVAKAIERLDGEAAKVLLVYASDLEPVVPLDERFLKPIIQCVRKNDLIPDYLILVLLAQCLRK